MSGYSIRAKFDATCPPEAVMKWLADPPGIAGWWSDTVEGSAGSVGDRFRVTFPTSPVVFELEVTEASERVAEWHIPENPPWWEGTTIRFDVSETEDGGTELMFTHRGFDAEDTIIAVITPAWVRFIDNLISVAESGQASPAVVN